MKSRRECKRPVTIHDVQLAERCARGRVVVIDDDAELRAAQAALFDLEGYACETHASADAYVQVLSYNRPSFPGPICVLCDVNLPGLGGLELQRQLTELDDKAFLLMSGASGAKEVVQAFRTGAVDFLIKPVDADVLLAAVEKALAVSRERQSQRERGLEISARIASLTEKERVVARRVAQGQTNQGIADGLGIALRTVKLHRHRAMAKLQVDTVVDLARLADEGNL